MADLIRLRDLPGIQKIKELCRNPRNFDDLKVNYTREEIADVSISLFGIAPEHTWFDEEDFDDPEEFDQYETWPLQQDRQRLPFWHAIGWDISERLSG